MAAAGYPWADPPEVITAARDRLKPRRHGPFK
jgi:hypothetical protein